LSLKTELGLLILGWHSHAIDNGRITIVENANHFM
jgi:hypothetical protein